MAWESRFVCRSIGRLSAAAVGPRAGPWAANRMRHPSIRAGEKEAAAVQVGGRRSRVDRGLRMDYVKERQRHRQPTSAKTQATASPRGRLLGCTSSNSISKLTASSLAREELVVPDLGAGAWKEGNLRATTPGRRRGGRRGRGEGSGRKRGAASRRRSAPVPCRGRERACMIEAASACPCSEVVLCALGPSAVWACRGTSGASCSFSAAARCCSRRRQQLRRLEPERHRLHRQQRRLRRHRHRLRRLHRGVQLRVHQLQRPHHGLRRGPRTTPVTWKSR